MISRRAFLKVLGFAPVVGTIPAALSEVVAREIAVDLPSALVADVEPAPSAISTRGGCYLEIGPHRLPLRSMSAYASPLNIDVTTLDSFSSSIEDSWLRPLDYEAEVSAYVDSDAFPALNNCMLAGEHVRLVGEYGPSRLVARMYVTRLTVEGSPALPIITNVSGRLADVMWEGIA